MRYKGQLYVDDDTFSGLPVELILMDRQLAVKSGEETIGRYPLAETTAQRIGGERFQLDIGSESLIFVADDALGFSYDAVPFIRSGGSHPTSVGFRRLVQKVFRTQDEHRGPDPSTAADRNRVADLSTAGGDTEATGAHVVDDGFLDLLDTPAPAAVTPDEAPNGPVSDEPGPETVSEMAAVVADPLPAGESEPVEGSRSEASRSPCEGALSDGSRCPMEPLSGSGLCHTHTGRLDAQQVALAERAERVAAAASRVGLPDLDEVLERLEKAVAQVHDGSLAPQQAMAMASLVQAMVETIELSRLRQG